MEYINTSVAYFEDWGDAFIISLQNAWFKIASFLPQLIGALVILALGLAIASVLGNLARRFAVYARVDSFLERSDVTQQLSSMGVSFSFSAVLGWIVKWFFIIVTLITVVDILEIRQVTVFLDDVLAYLPNVIAAVIILAIGLVVGTFVATIIDRIVTASRLPSALRDMLAPVAQWAIIVFAVLAALVQLGIAASLIQILFSGLIAMVALAGGLAFGLGGRDTAARWLDRMSRAK